MNKKILKKKLHLFKEFAGNEAAGGFILIAITVLAVLLSNIPSTKYFTEIWGLKLHIQLGDAEIGFTLLQIINDGLMVVFFFVVGLEIKREMLLGELSSIKKALLPMIGAVGGFIIPAIIYMAINLNGRGQNGWAIPVATDIAFVVGILALLKSRIPLSLKIFLTALAIVDDIFAVIIIAVFYTAHISIGALLVASLFLVGLVAANLTGVKRLGVYSVLGIGLWLAFLASGVHATIAGVILAFTIPAKSSYKQKDFVHRVSEIAARIGLNLKKQTADNTDKEQLSLVDELQKNCENAIPPLQRFEKKLHNWITYMIVPLFALANAGVKIGSNFTALVFDPVSIGIILGLFFGKQAGIFGFSYLAIKLKIAENPIGTSMRNLYGAAILGGIGFTMSLFIAGLSFHGNEIMDAARVGILIASIISGIVGYIILRK